MNDFQTGYLMGSVDQQCSGWSNVAHFNFFRDVLAAIRGVPRVLVLGVAHGRDIGYMHKAMAFEERKVDIWGVDLFADVPGTDWPEDKKGMTWEQAGFGPAPSLESTKSNLAALGVNDVLLVKADAAEFLRGGTTLFDFIYIDVAHDYETTKTVLALSEERLVSGGVLAGDDYTDEGTYGVKRAVGERFSSVAVTDRIWAARVFRRG